MPANFTFIDGLLSIVESWVSTGTHGTTANYERLEMIRAIAALPPGSKSVRITQERLLERAEKRWPV